MFQKDVNSSPSPGSSEDVKVNIRNVNHVQANAKAISTGEVSERRWVNNKPRRSLSSDRQNLGKLPSYLIRRKNEEAARIAADKAAKGRAQTPVGHRRVSEEERINTLHSLEEVYAKTIEEFNRVPLSADTSRAQKQRADLEDKLSDLEEIMGAFRKPIVFIELD